MKKLFLLLIAILALNGCNKDNIPFRGKDQLPPETQTGANTVGCLVNGEVFLPHAEGLSPEVNCFYQFLDGEFYFSMAFSDLRNGGSESVVIQTRRLDLKEEQTYVLNKNIIDDGDFTGGGGIYTPSAGRFYTSTIKTGELKITHLDISHSIISGTFWFDAVNSTGEVVGIREGRFDWNY